MTRNELKDIIKECLLETNIEYKKSDNSDRCKLLVDKKIESMQIELGYSFSKDESKKEKNIKKLEYFDDDYKILKSKWNSIKKQILSEIKDYCVDWDEDPKNVKYAHFDFCEYNISEKRGRYFTVGFNNSDKFGDRSKLLGGHSIFVDLYIKDNNIKIDEIELMG